METMTIDEKKETGNAAQESVMSLQNVTKVYNTKSARFEALRGLSFDVHEGEFLSITGESGSGKSTLLSILGGISPPTEGNVQVEGIDIYSLPIEQLADFRREYIGFVFQQFHLIPYLTAYENVMLPLVITERSAVEKKELAHESLGRVGLADKAGNLPSEMSGGQQQRVAIARALVNEPPIILADEPTGNLDTKTGEEIFSLFEQLNNAGETVILVTHNHALSERTGRVVTLKDGLISNNRENG
ncbi:ABC transporter ATP-binding protein [Nitrospirota bacterium]